MPQYKERKTKKGLLVTVHLSGTDQIHLLLRHINGGFLKYIRKKQNDYYFDRRADIALAERIRKWERKHSILLIPTSRLGVVRLRRHKFR